MVTEERAKKLAEDLDRCFWGHEEVAVAEEFADEIRRESADRADVWAIKELAIREQRQRLRSAIMGKEAGE